MMMNLIILLAAGATVVASLPDSVPDSEWRQKYDDLFELTKFQQAPKRRMDADETKQVLEHLSELIKDPSQSGAIPKEERDEVEFWSRAVDFKVEDCNRERESALQKQYRVKLPRLDFSRPNLMVYIKHVKKTMVEYCVHVVHEIVVKPIEDIPVEQRTFVGSFGTEDYPPTLKLDDIVRFLAPSYVGPQQVQVDDGTAEKPSLIKETKEIFEKQIGQACDAVTNLPERVKDAILYIEFNDALARVNPCIKEWSRLDVICKTMPNYLDYFASMAPIEIRRQYARI